MWGEVLAHVFSDELLVEVPTELDVAYFVSHVTVGDQLVRFGGVDEEWLEDGWWVDDVERVVAGHVLEEFSWVVYHRAEFIG